MKVLLLSFLLISPTAWSRQSPEASEQFVQKFIESFNLKDFEACYQLTSSAFRSGVSAYRFNYTLTESQQFSGQIKSFKLIEKKEYVRIFHLVGTRGVIVLSLLLDANEKADGLFLQQGEKAIPQD